MSTVDPTKSRLLESAGEEFAEKGFEGATIRSICRRAGANLAAVNYHFGDKEQLYLQALLEAHRCGAVVMAPDEEFFVGSPADQLRRFIRDFVGQVLMDPEPGGWQPQLLLRELLQPTGASEVLVRRVMRPTYERLARILRPVCPEADERRLTALALSVIGQCVHYKMARPIHERLLGTEALQSLDAEYLADHIASFTMAALGLTPPLDAAGEPARAEAEGEAPCAGSR